MLQSQAQRSPVLSSIDGVDGSPRWVNGGNGIELPGTAEPGGTSSVQTYGSTDVADVLRVRLWIVRLCL